MRKFAIASLACILGIAATISQAADVASPIYRLQRRTLLGIEEKILSEDEYKEFMKDAEARKVWGEIPPAKIFVGDEILPATSSPRHDGGNPAEPVARHAADKCQPGTFSVVSDGKRQIRINTNTGESWLLVIDQIGSHWQRINNSPLPSEPAVSAPRIPVQYLPAPATPQVPSPALVPAAAGSATMSSEVRQRLNEPGINSVAVPYGSIPSRPAPVMSAPPAAAGTWQQPVPNSTQPNVSTPESGHLYDPNRLSVMPAPVVNPQQPVPALDPGVANSLEAMHKDHQHLAGLINEKVAENRNLNEKLDEVEVKLRKQADQAKANVQLFQELAEERDAANQEIDELKKKLEEAEEKLKKQDDEAKPAPSPS